MTHLLNWINLSNTLWFKNHRKKVKYSLKRECAFNRLTEDIAPGNSGSRTLRSNRWVARGTLLQSILDNWAVLGNEILEGKVDSEIRGQVIGARTQTQSFNFLFFFNITGSFNFDAYRQPIFYSAIHTRQVTKLSKLQ